MAEVAQSTQVKEAVIHRRPPFWKRVYMIKRAWQMKYIVLVCASIIVVSAMSLWHMYFEFSQLKDSITPEFAKTLASVQLGIVVRQVIFTFIVLVLAVIFSHTFAGPIFRVERSCEEVGRGDLTARIKLRKDDDLTDLKEAFNQMTASLQSKLKADQDLVQDLASRLEQMTKSSNLQSHDSELLKGIKNDLGKIGSQFKI